MRRTLLVLIFLSIARAAGAQTPTIDYTLSTKNPLSHLYTVEIQIRGLQSTSVNVAMPAWSPGVYVVRDYAANVQEFEALNLQGRPLQFQQLDKQTWRITKTSVEDIRVRYRVYSSALNDEMADITPAAVFMYVVGQTQAPVSVRFETEGDWKVYTALEKRGDRYTSPDYESLVSGAVFLGVFKVLEFESTKVPYRVLFSNPRIQMTERQVEADLNDLADAAARTFGSIPYSDYTFFVRVQPTSGSSSIGYRNSSRMTVGENDFVNQSSYRTFLTAAGISLVKAWYGRAARPASMQPYDFAREAYSRLFWFSEGVAAYSSDMLLLRSGLLTSIEYLARASVEVDSLQRLPGRLVTSLEESSWNTWTRSENGANTAVSYILKGKIAGMLLDAEIRGKTANAKSLDDVLRHLLRQADIRRAGLPEDGLESAVMAATGVNVRELLDAVTRGKGEIDYNRFLAPMGIQAATMKNPGTIYLGVDFERIEANQARIRRVVPGSPAEDAKLDGGDILLAMDSERVTFDNLASRLHSKPLGKSVSLLVLRGERLLTLSITPRMNETETWSVGEALSATPDQRRRRDAWLAGL